MREKNKFIRYLHYFVEDVDKLDQLIYLLELEFIKQTFYQNKVENFYYI